MAITRDDLLKKFVKRVTLVVKELTDESGENAEVKVLHLAEAVTAKSSVPMQNGTFMSLKSSDVYIAGSDNIEAFLQNCTEKDGALVYEGDMHLDVSRPNVRLVNGVPTVTKPARVWLSKTKFTKLGGNARQEQQKALGSVLSQMFGKDGEKTLTYGEEFIPKFETTVQPTADGKVEPVLVPNRPAAPVKP